MIPSLHTFLHLPKAELVPLAPASVVYTMGGTRRAAALAGIKPESNAYIQWTRDNMIRGVDLLFQYGVKHVFIMAITPKNYQEAGAYRERLLEFTDWGIAGPQAIADYQRLGWRVRLTGSEDIPELQSTAERLIQQTNAHSPHSLWCQVIPDDEAPWRQLFNSQAVTREAAIEAIYGTAVPPITLFLSTGKPLFSLNLLPPLLVGQVQCYWRQQPGHSLTETEWRTILYDYAYTRATWREDKEGRAESALVNQSAWQQAPTLGLGIRLGSFWYPQPIHPLENNYD